MNGTELSNGSWEEEDLGLYRHSGGVTGVLVLAYALILGLGVVGNSLVVGVVLRSPRMRTVTNLFILNLALADLLVVLFCLPPTLLSNILVPWVLGSLMCKTVPYVQGVSVSASVYSLLAVSMDRFIAIWFPLGGGLSRGRARWIILVIWILAGCLALPWLLFFELVETDQFEFCVEVWPAGFDGELYFLIANLLLCYLFPLGGISVCYVLIWFRVGHRDVPSDSAAALHKMHEKAKMGVLRMVVVVVLVFLLSWLPLYALFARIKLGGRLSGREEELVAMATPAAQWLGSSNSCINPILYAFLNVKFRRAFQSLLPNCCKAAPARCPSQTKSSLLRRPPSSLYNSHPAPLPLPPHHESPL